MNRPNLFLVGAMKSGSTTLHDHLAEHPEIFMSSEKEPGFFVPELWGDKGEKAYSRLFEAVTDEKYCGESSTHYTKLPTYAGVVERIYHYASNAKILYVVRHPIKRTVSHYLHNRRTLDFHPENRPILKAIRQEDKYTSYSNYAMQIRPYYDRFGKENVQVILFEELISSPEKVLREIFQWLGVASSIPISCGKKSNAAPSTASTVRGLGLLNALRYSALWDRLSPLFPKKIKILGNVMAESQEVLTVSPHELDQVERKLQEQYRDYVSDLELLTGRSFSSWQI